MTIVNSFDENGVNFVSRSSKNLGIDAKIKKLSNKEPYPAGLITVTLGGTYLLSSFVQPEPFYTAQNIMVLTPKQNMSFQEKIFYCLCIAKNRFRYVSHGREANKTLKNLEIPSKVPKWVNSVKIPKLENISEPILDKPCKLTDRKWKKFIFPQIFEIKKGKRVIVSKILDEHGKFNFVSAIDSNNGVFCKTNLKPNHPANVITVNYDGNGVADAFYQYEPFWALDSVNVLYPKFILNPFIAMFLITLIRKEKYRFNYGRKWNKERMEKSLIKLPIDESGNPDWKFMEDYIKSLPYSSNLTN